MEDTSQSRLASILTLLVGIWVVISPIWISVSGAALTSVIIVGIVMIVAALLQLFFVEVSVPSWIVALAAIWLFISTFIFGVGTAAAYSQIISAIVAFVFAIWDGAEVMHIQSHPHQHSPAS